MRWRSTLETEAFPPSNPYLSSTKRLGESELSPPLLTLSARPYDAREDRPRAHPRGWPQDASPKDCIPSRLQPPASRLVSAFPERVPGPPFTVPARSDNWDHMVFVKMFGRLTVYDFSTPPEAVLDLGCGTGLWCIEAARQWPVCVSLRM